MTVPPRTDPCTLASCGRTSCAISMADSPTVRPVAAAPETSAGAVREPVTGPRALRDAVWPCGNLLVTVGRIIGAWLRRVQFGRALAVGHSAASLRFAWVPVTE